jgi:hypothetical protein
MIRTHRMNRFSFTDWEDHTCEFCSRPAAYWSQNEPLDPDAPPRSRTVWHCQAHRGNARRVIRQAASAMRSKRIASFWRWINHDEGRIA